MTKTLKTVDKKKILEVFGDRKLVILQDISNITDPLVPIKCKDEEGYLYSLSTLFVMRSACAKFDYVGKNNPFSIQNIQHFIDINSGTAKILSDKYTDIHTKLDLKCDCGNTYQCCWTHLKGIKKFQCNKCGYGASSQERANTFEDMAKEVKELTGHTLFKKGTNSKELHIITLEGYKYVTSINVLRTSTEKRKGKIGKCTLFNQSNPYTIENMKNYIKLKEIDLEILEENGTQINVRNDYIKCKCQCGNIFYPTWGQISLPNYKRHRCPKCQKLISSNEYEVLKYLKSKGVKVEKEKTMEGCKSKRLLAFDFYLPEYNYVIEVQGKQHYVNGMFYAGNNNLENQKLHDQIKRDFCKKNGIGYLEIPYWRIKNTENNQLFKEDIDKILN